MCSCSLIEVGPQKHLLTSDVIHLKSSGLKFEVVSGLQEPSGQGFRLDYFKKCIGAMQSLTLTLATLTSRLSVPEGQSGVEVTFNLLLKVCV